MRSNPLALEEIASHRYNLTIGSQINLSAHTHTKANPAKVSVFDRYGLSTPSAFLCVTRKQFSVPVTYLLSFVPTTPEITGSNKTARPHNNNDANDDKNYTRNRKMIYLFTASEMQQSPIRTQLQPYAWRAVCLCLHSDRCSRLAGALRIANRLANRSSLANRSGPHENRRQQILSVCRCLKCAPSVDGLECGVLSDSSRLLELFVACVVRL